MQTAIQKALFRVKLFFFLFWLLPFIMVVGYETMPEWVGHYAHDVRAVYLSEVLVILLAVVCVPSALKLFAWMMRRQVDQVDVVEAMRLYVLWSGVRLVLLIAPVLAGLYIYYSMLSTKALLCACIGLTASLFCVPGATRMRRELHIDKLEF